MPSYERLTPITSYLNAPTAIALDPYECIYVTESVNNRLFIYSQSGEYDKMLAGLNRPISVAADANGRIYIGNKDSRNVEVYNTGLTLLFKLGSGNGEFTQPNDIAIKSNGKIYVADSSEDKIKIYNADGTYDTSIGTSGSGDGQFHKPLSIEIDETAGEIIVLDRKLTYDQYGSLVDGARIQIFDINGVFKSGFSSYGQNVGQMYRPQHIALDGEGRIYVTDTFQNVALVYDKDGAYLGAVYDLSNPLRTPLGITMGKSDRLFIASLNSKKVEVYGIGQYTQMAVTPLSLSFEGRQDGDNPASQGVSITNNGTEELNWTASTTEGWITLSATSGTTEVSQTTALNLGINLAGLAADTYLGSVRISAASGASEIVEVELTVLPTPILSVTPSSLEYTSVNGSTPASKSLSVTNTGAGTLDFTASTNRSWIQINREAGTAPAEITVTIGDITSLAQGAYTGAVTITGGSAGTREIPVTLNIVSVTGTIQVTTNLQAAAYIMNGPESYTGSGASWTRTNAPVGTYAIVFGAVPGYTAPMSQSKTLEANGTITFSGEYTSEAEPEPEDKGKIIVGAGPGKSNSGLVKVFNADGSEAGAAFLAHAYKYGVNVAAGDLNHDGKDEIITAPGPGPDNPAEIRIYNPNGNELANLKTTAYEYKYGATVASGDLNGDGYDEVIVGTGAGADTPAYIKVYVYDPAQQKMTDSGINLLAYNTGYGVNVAAGDVDGDGTDEIITAPGAGRSNTGTIKIWKADTTMGAGQWSATQNMQYTAVYKYKYSVTIASGDINGDGSAEIITGAGPDRRAHDDIKIYDGSGDKVSEFRAYMVRNYGVNVACGDLDKDGVAEIVAGAGGGAGNRAMVKVFDANGVEKASFKAFNTRFGVNVAVGDF
ncbi:MAG: VCBS repeat-containing protein [Nitrospirae bacterium]|nr:VCBS repeat-containing protein [Nitrospirota bacterium]